MFRLGRWKSRCGDIWKQAGAQGQRTLVAAAGAAATATALPRRSFCASASASTASSSERRMSQTFLPAFEALEVEKPSTDYREYKTAVLPNNLRVMVVSDAKCDRAAAALSVQVGSIFDPKEIPGLAHFCEHMLFLGTEKYPDEGEYNEYLAKNGGSSNAYTAETVTNYYFGVKPEALEGALDRFAEFFLTPLFTESATARELQAVDSEHSKNLQQDSWRQMQLMRHAADEGHPLHHFMTGNRETLQDRPAKEGIDVRKALLDFHSKYYSANLMRLVIVGREDPDQLLAMAADRFAAVVNKDVRIPRDKEIGGGKDAFPPERLARIAHVVPVNDVKTATFNFFMPSQKSNWRSKPTRYMAHLLGHEGEGSLLALLKQRGLATELSAGSTLDEAGEHVFSVSMQLTEKGQDDIATVGHLVFAYIRLLQDAGPKEDLWRELQQLSDIGFRFRSMSDSMSTASGLAHVLQEHEPEVALSAGTKLWDYEPSKVKELLGFLTCDRLLLVLCSKAHASKCTSEEPWYGTRYSDSPLDPALRTRWEQASGVPGLALPRANPFMPADLELRPPEAASLKPQLLDLEEDLARVAVAFYRKDEDFKLPKAVTAFMVYCPYTGESLEHRMKAEIWCLAVQEELNEFAYDARMAGLSYSLQAAPTGMIVSFAGYNDKLQVLMSAVADKMVSLTEIPEQSFNIARNILERNLMNAAERSAPYQQCFMHENCAFLQPAASYRDRLVALQSLERESLSGVGQELLQNCHVEGLLQGNVCRDEAQELVGTFLRRLDISRQLKDLPPVGCAQLPPGWTLLERPGTNPDERNGAVVVRFQASEYSLSSHVLVTLASQVLSQRFFDDLRTKQQLGYIVNAGSFSEPHGFVGLRLIVQSEHPIYEVVEKMRRWAEEAWKSLEQLSEAEFQEYRMALLSKLKERPKSLGEDFSRNWSVVASRMFDFHRREETIACLEHATLHELQSFARDRLAAAPAACVLVASTGSCAADAVPAPTADRSWSEEDVAAFRATAIWHMQPSSPAAARGGLAPSSSKL
eukprot:TRINITY_DN9981_c1_g1_i1.p1 TRINITY_DN9981_c1_g1~~TRINITY_DN9981_c1_g1_i1.p1  ORF type:complete len:1036 (+),score=223.57 TRINITY_DN9981_c1_g1_i1:81-3188(+)